ncbi:ROK family protein [Sunxiuqinia sp. sy24]|uniref:ROK family protein n=1 Tax=Sunxiuqinia sp. sy24 TaxID=3461495 RepID=UPI0040466E2A
MVLHKKEDTDRMAIRELKRYKLRMQVITRLYKKSPQSALSLCNQTHVSLPTVRSVLDQLISEKKVCISGTGTSKGGRRPLLYSHSQDAYYIVAVELGHHKAKALLLNSLNQEVTRIHEYPTNINDHMLEEHMEEALSHLLKESGLARDRISAIGVSMPGLIDSESGINQTIKIAGDRNIKERLTNRFNIPVHIENDARMQALGEFIFGKAKNTKNTLVLNWTWGLGLGIILNGQIYQGSNGCAGEFSHIRILPEGELCECGKQGCLQTIASTQKLLKMAMEAIKQGTVSQLTKRFSTTPTKMKVDDIINCAQNGDELSISLLNKISTKLAWGLSILIQLYNPELIVLNGPLTKAGKYILMPIQQALNKYCLENISNNVKIEISEMGEHSGLKGASAMIFQKIFRDKSMDKQVL